LIEEMNRQRFRLIVLWWTCVIIGLVMPVAEAIEIHGHRGARGLAPENTIEGFRAALSVGVDVLEMDLAMTVEGEVVVVHGPTLVGPVTRHPNGEWVGRDARIVVNELTLADLSRYDVGRIRPGSRYAGRFPDQVPIDGVRVPSLATLLDQLNSMGRTHIRLNIEPKIDPTRPELSVSPGKFVSALVSLLEVYDVQDRTIVQSFDWRVIRELRRIAPDISRSCLTVQSTWLNNVRKGEEGTSPWTAGLDVDDFDQSIPRLVAAARCQIWSPHYREVTAEEVSEARRLGLKTIVWTVNDRDEMERMIALSVNGIITDRPDLLREVMHDVGLPLPPTTAF
jgi:glycerophosphoryl diester phosphodiesterase